MRKLAWFVIIVLIVALAIAVACAYSPPFSATVYDFGVNTVGASIVNGVTGLMTGMMAWGSANLAQAAAVFFGVGIGFTVLWLVLLKKYIWKPLSGSKTITTASASLRGGPEPELPQSIEQVKPKEETPT
jgi:peptidoglycan/LPS O-acetylase OafA/YrhL